MARLDLEAPWLRKERPIGLMNDENEKALLPKVKNRRFPPPGFDIWADGNDKNMPTRHERAKANAQKLGDWDRDGQAREYAVDPLVTAFYEAAELMAFLSQANKGHDFHKLGTRLADCLADLNQSGASLAPIVNGSLDYANMNLDRPAQEKFSKKLSRPKDRPLPPAFSERWALAIKNQRTYRGRAMTDFANYLNPTPEKPKVGRPKKYLGGAKDRKAASRRRQRRRKEVETDFHETIQEDAALLKMVAWHLDDLEEQGGHPINIAVIRSACDALVAGRFAQAKLHDGEASTEPGTKKLTSAAS